MHFYIEVYMMTQQNWADQMQIQQCLWDKPGCVKTLGQTLAIWVRYKVL